MTNLNVFADVSTAILSFETFARFWQGSMEIPEQMCAAVIRQHGGDEAIRVERVPIPQSKSGDVLVAVVATALNYLDVLM